jgi:WXG100 family type VII secretion target
VVEYSVDLKLLQETTDKIERLVRDITSAIDTVHSDVANPCQDALQGATGTAFQDKHSQWSATITRANGETAEMRAAAQQAHDNYSAAKTANRAMLGR